MIWLVCWFKSQLTAMVMSELSFYLTMLFFLDKLAPAVNQNFVHKLLLVTDNKPSQFKNARKITIEIIS